MLPFVGDLLPISRGELIQDMTEREIRRKKSRMKELNYKCFEQIKEKGGPHIGLEFKTTKESQIVESCWFQSINGNRKQNQT